MTALTGMLLPALALSGMAAAALALLPDAPLRLRFAIAVVGLGAWVVPWPWISVPVPMSLLLPLPLPLPLPLSLPLPSPLPLADLGAGSGLALGTTVRLAGEWSGGARGAADFSAFFGRVEHLDWVVLVLFLPGVLAWVADRAVLYRRTRLWRINSCSGESLRSLLPAELRDTRADIRIVAGMSVAAASGFMRPTVWIGERLAGDHLELALVHEFWHVRRRDPLRIFVIAAIRRAYWWNPIVAYLARQSVLMTEAICDRHCARSLGRRHYIERLASMMLDAEASGPGPASGFVAMARSASLNVLRLKLLSRSLRVRRRDRVTVGLLLFAGAASAAIEVVDISAADHSGASPSTGASAAMPAWSRVAIPATPAGAALTALLDAFNSGDAEFVSAYLGAYTPQEIHVPLFDWIGRVELLAVVSSEQLVIEYVVGRVGGETQRVGRLEVENTKNPRIRDSELRELP